jgi:hypothetical protein
MDDPYMLSKISKATLFVLSCNYAADPKIKAPGSLIKKEHHNLTKIDYNFVKRNLNINTLISKIIKQLNGQAPSTQGNQVLVPASGQQFIVSAVFSAQR